MVNNRIYFANSAFGLSRQSTGSYIPIHGLQAGGINTNFTLEHIQEIGQLEIYQSIEDIPDIEVTLQKVIDGYPLMLHLATAAASANTIASRSNVTCEMAASIFDDDQSSASGTPIAEVNASGLYWSSSRFEMPVEGNCTEDITLVGNHVVWKTSGFTFTNPFPTNADSPLALASGLGGVQRRQNVVFGGSSLASMTILPKGISGIPGISASGTNDKTADVYGAHVQRITVSLDLNKEELFELGRRAAFFRSTTFPVDVTTEIDVLSTLGNQVSAFEAGAVPGSGTNLADQTIRVVLQDTTNVYLGTRNKLQSVSFNNTIGSNVVDTFTYVNQNFFQVTHNQNPGVN